MEFCKSQFQCSTRMPELIMYLCGMQYYVVLSPGPLVFRCFSNEKLGVAWGKTTKKL